MKKRINRNVLRNGFCIILFLCIIGAYFNGFTHHPIKGEELEKHFLKSVGGKEEHDTVTKQKYKNSMTFFYGNENQNRTTATYIKSIYQNRWKEVFRRESQQNNEVYHTAIDDHIFVYGAEYDMNLKKALFEDVTKPESILIKIKMLVICFCGAGIGIALKNGFCSIKKM